MRLLCLAKGYASYGASILTAASEHLGLSLMDLEPTNLAIEITAFITHDGPPRQTLEALLEDHIAKFPKQMRVRFRSKVGKLNIEYPSGLREAESFGKPGGNYAAHVLPRALDELSGVVVEGLRSKPAIWSKIDVARLNEAIEKSKAALPASPDRISHYMRQMDETRVVSLKARTSIDDLDIDWSRYHPAARAILGAPFFWSEIDDDAPHGNTLEATCLPLFSAGTGATPPHPAKAMSTGYCVGGACPRNKCVANWTNYIWTVSGRRRTSLWHLPRSSSEATAKIARLAPRSMR